MRPMLVSSAVSLRPEFGALDVARWKIADDRSLDFRADLLELVGQPVDDRIEQAHQHRRRVARQLRLAPDMLANARTGLGVA